MAFATTWVGLEPVISEVTQEWNKQTSYVLTHVWELNYEDTKAKEHWTSGTQGKRDGKG